MTKFYIKFQETIITYVYKNKEFNYLYETECESNLLLESDLWEVESVDEENKSCVIKKIIEI